MSQGVPKIEGSSAQTEATLNPTFWNMFSAQKANKPFQ